MKKQDLLKYFDDNLLDKLFGFCYARTNDSYEAEELCSDIICSIVESEILDNMSNLFSNRTMIVISHKPLVNFKKDETHLVENKHIVKTA